ncbi:retrovirus-related pol polyprotein from transposon TNT 1-94 [Tanacetum coccineum]|uniref:Retrovirus-related pol polyprotein from transposon TNT 1-94 n=1 Tax=Tanacetum coccineum TaxID=301880 RepID=A0ABQ5FFQ6_9ASTR
MKHQKCLNVSKIQVLLQSLVIIVRTDNGTKFKNKVLKEYFDDLGISYQMSFVKTPQQNGVIEQRNWTLVEAARTMLIFSCALLFLWAEAIATTVLYYPMNDCEDIEKLGAKGLDLTYAPLTITSQKQTERELDLLFKAMYDDYISILPPAAPRTTPVVLATQVLQTPTASTTTANTASTPTNSSSQVADSPITLQDVDEPSQQQHVQQKDNQALLQPKIVADNVPNTTFDGDVFENPFAPPSISVVESSSSHYVDP